MDSTRTPGNTLFGWHSPRSNCISVIPSPPALQTFKHTQVSKLQTGVPVVFCGTFMIPVEWVSEEPHSRPWLVTSCISMIHHHTHINIYADNLAWTISPVSLNCTGFLCISRARSPLAYFSHHPPQGKTVTHSLFVSTLNTCSQSDFGTVRHRFCAGELRTVGEERKKLKASFDVSRTWEARTESPGRGPAPRGPRGTAWAGSATRSQKLQWTSLPVICIRIYDTGAAVALPPSRFISHIIRWWLWWGGGQKKMKSMLYSLFSVQSLPAVCSQAVESFCCRDCGSPRLMGPALFSVNMVRQNRLFAWPNESWLRAGDYGGGGGSSPSACGPARCPSFKTGMTGSYRALFGYLWKWIVQIKQHSKLDLHFKKSRFKCLSSFGQQFMP